MSILLALALRAITASAIDITITGAVCGDSVLSRSAASSSAHDYSAAVTFTLGRSLYVELTLSGTIYHVADSTGRPFLYPDAATFAGQLDAGTYTVRGVVAYDPSHPPVTAYLHTWIHTYTERPVIPPYRLDTTDYTAMAAMPPVLPLDMGNYVRTATPTTDKQEADFDPAQGEMVVTTYYDGLGRPGAEMLHGGAGDGINLVTLNGYDRFGRMGRTWLPVPDLYDNMDSDYEHLADARIFAEDAADYYGDAVPYASVSYEHSPMGRKTEDRGAGLSWANFGKHISHEYGINASEVVRWIPDGQRFVKAGTYPAGELRKTVTTDEDGRVYTTYTDKTGHDVLKRRGQGASARDTYYLYDSAGRLCYVLPPQVTGPSVQDASTDTPLMAKYIYAYQYNDRDLCTAKRLPSCEPVYYVYDDAGRLVFTQDGNQRTRGEWSFSIPDVFGRPCISGICKNVPAFGGNIIPSVVKAGRASGSSLMGYQVTGVTLVSPEVLKAVYYDDYSFLGCYGFDASAEGGLGYAEQPGYGERYASSAKGMETGSATALLDGADSLTYHRTVSYYDGRGRLVQQKSENILGGTDCHYMAYSATDKPTKKKTVYDLPSGQVEAEEYIYAYDTLDRPLTVTHSINGSTPVTLASYTYDALGRTATKTVGGVETVNYGYNIRSWPTKIQSAKFTELMGYNASVNGMTVSHPRWNGDISALCWKGVGNGTTYRGYEFDYDDTDRLVCAWYGGGLNFSGTEDYYDEYFTYDRMGNITNLMRGGRLDDNSYGLIDDLDMEYDGNRLTRVYDYSSDDDPTYEGAMQFTDNSDEDVEYEYDQNGNMTKDLNSNITSIQYNCLNLPSRIYFTNRHVMDYVYNADGELQQMSARALHQLPRPQLDTKYYVGNVVYFPGKLSLLTDEGYVTFASNGTPTYHYYLKDHLGNVRVVFNQTGTVEQRNDYYPSGTLMATSTGGSVQPYKYNGKELERTAGLDLYYYGARWMDSKIGARFTTIDPMCEEYYDISPYAYCAGNPVNLVDPDGERIYMLFYTTGNNRGDEMFKSAAVTRKLDIENSKDFDSDKDIVIMASISDLGTLRGTVSDIVDTYSEQYGKTAEFSMWSHGRFDGPVGTSPTSSDAVDGNQMSLEGWSKIDFNWDNQATANFYGCNTGNAEKGTSFSTNISGLSNFKDVTVHGQISYAYPSVYTDSRQTNQNILDGRDNFPTYFVSSRKSVPWGRFMATFTPAYPMRESKNGIGRVSQYYQPGRKSKR